MQPRLVIAVRSAQALATGLTARSRGDETDNRSQVPAAHDRHPQNGLATFRTWVLLTEYFDTCRHDRACFYNVETSHSRQDFASAAQRLVEVPASGHAEFDHQRSHRAGVANCLTGRVADAACDLTSAGQAFEEHAVRPASSCSGTIASNPSDCSDP
jgi:hypothetical protein